MPIQTAYSTKELPDAVADLRVQCGALEPRVVLFFASVKYDPKTLSQQMQAAFPNACVAGCSTAGELASGRMLTESVVAMFLGEDIVDTATTALVEHLTDGVDLAPALAHLEQHWGAPVAALDMRKYVGLVLADGLSGAEESLMEKLGDATDVFFVGGSAGDDLQFHSTYVTAHGKPYRDAALLVLLRLKRSFEILKTQSFQPTGKSLVATKVDERTRTVLEFNGRPALDAYAEALGVAPAQAHEKFLEHPLGLMILGEPYVRSPQHTDGSSIVFYCQIREGTELELLSGTDIVADTRAAIEARQSVQPGIQGIIDFHCILRTLELRREQRCTQYGEIFSRLPMIGFSTYGEAYLGHMNQTSTILIFR